MIYFKNNALIIGAIKRILRPVIKLIDKVLTKLNLYMFVTVLIIGALMFLLGVFSNNKNVLYFFYAGLVISLLYAVIKTKNKIVKKSGIKKRKNAETSQQPVNQAVNVYESGNEQANVQQVNNTGNSYGQQVPDYNTYVSQQTVPRYFFVRGKPGYVMAEYSDRYELFYKTQDGLKKIRVDMK